jgi:DNA-binding CsgD family transcriptional regulator/DNA polymerase III delta prime subunit
MPAKVVGRASELDAIERLLDSLEQGPAALLLEGEPGIGKTTLVLAGIEAARQRGIQVYSCAGSNSEARLSYAALADLYRDVDIEALKDLPPPQRDALDAALLRAHPESAIDPLAVASASLSVVEELAMDGSVLIAIDDLQWLDNPTSRVVEFCARRIAGPIGVLAARRPGSSDGAVPPAIELSRPDRVELQIVGALSDAELKKLLRERAPDPLERRLLARISEASGGNPFYALELSRELDAEATPAASLPLPKSLEEVIATKIAGLPEEVYEALLATAALADPTPSLLEQAFGADAVAALEAAEERQLVVMDGDRVRFAHPLLAHGIYTGAAAPRRREMHRRLSAAVSDPEERARHLAHARVLPDAIDALDEAARYVRARGAPDAAADLLELALELGGGDELLVRVAEHHFDAGDMQRAYGLAERAIDALDAGEKRAEALRLLGELRFHANSYTGARDALEQARSEAGSNDRLEVAIGVELAHVYFQLGLWETAAESAESALAAARRLGEPGLIAQSLGTTALVDLCLGRGLDEARLEEAVRLEDPRQRTGIAGAPSLHAFFVFLWAGRFDDARAAIARLRQRYAERGEEPALAWISAADAQLECWSGNIAAASVAADEALERGLLQMGTTGRALALWARSLVDAYSGLTDEARRGAEESLALFEQAGSRSFPLWPLTTLGFIELSVGDHEAAASRLAPAAFKAISDGRREPAADGTLFTGDAAEALIGVGRIEEAEEIVSLLEERGAALDRVWAIAVGARCRGLILAAQGDVEEAERAVERALAEHERLPMPIERARTLLVLGRIRRRLRKRRAAKEALDEALEIFERAGSPRWADQARSEIGSIGLRPAATGDELTPAEARVAELVATGLSNKEVAAALVVSPKTVEAHLGRAYRKLGVRRRSELTALMAKGDRAQI